MCFKPLQNGAVLRRLVIIAFYAVRGVSFKPLQNGAVLRSTHRSLSGVRPDRSRFKPLQNGAVLRRCLDPIFANQWQRMVSNPFKTGRYCVAPFPSSVSPWRPKVSNPFKTGRYCVGSPRPRQGFPLCVSNPFKTGRYCVAMGHPCGGSIPSVSNPFKTGRYCVAFTISFVMIGWLRVSNPFKTGRYCVEEQTLVGRGSGPEFQTPSKRGGTA